MASLLSAGLRGIEAFPVHIEVALNTGLLPKWSTVGLAESAVRESKDRVIAAIRNSGYEFAFNRITINLAPAHQKKTGTAYDLPVALALLAANDLIPKDSLKGLLVAGELSLSGKTRPIPGAMAMVSLAKDLGLKAVILPPENIREAQTIAGPQTLGAPDLPAVVEYLLGRNSLPSSFPQSPLRLSKKPRPLDLSEVKGQESAKRALEVAAAGFHHFAFIGPPGTGKSLIIRRLPSILPELNLEEAMETSKIYSLVGKLPSGEGLIKQRPFRAPHHTISDAGLIGGGTHPRPGDVTMAHNGVLFLDELPEFRRNVLESLRQPLEDHEVTISRTKESLTFPARFLLATAMNPCPCGHRGNPLRPCRCTDSIVQKYRSKISGPLWDRMDLQVAVPQIPFQELQSLSKGESSEVIRERVTQATKRQCKRLSPLGLWANSQMGPKEIEKFCPLKTPEKKLLEWAAEKWELSARGIHRILRTSRFDHCWASETISVRFRRAA